jgi:hypothetical protein
MLASKFGVVAAVALGSVAVVPQVASATTAVPLSIPSATAFSLLGHSCGGIQQQDFATGFDPTSGLPEGAVKLSTRCGGSGRGGGAHSTTYNAWVAVAWDFTGAVVRTTVVSTPPSVSSSFTATDTHGNVLQGSAIYGVMPVATLLLAPSFVPAPRVTGLSVVTGSTAGGTSVVITGTGLSGATAVSFGSLSASQVAVVNDSMITAVSPPAASGPVDVSVTTAGGTSVVSSGDTFTFVAPPSVTAITPPNGLVAGGTTVTITGSSLATTSSVTFGDVPASFWAVNDSTLTATVPGAEAPGPVTVTVSSPYGTSSASSTTTYTYGSGLTCAGQCVTIGDSSIVQSTTRAQTMTFTVTLGQASTKAVRVHFATGAEQEGEGPADRGGAEVKAVSGTVVFPVQRSTGRTATSATISVVIAAEGQPEQSETFPVVLSNPTGSYSLARSTAIGSILASAPSVTPG